MDKKLLSKEKHEVTYVKRVAKNHLIKTQSKYADSYIIVRVGQLRRLCKYIMKR